MNRRAVIAAIVLLIAAGARTQLHGIEPPAGVSLQTVPLTLAEWKGTAGLPLDPAVTAILRADDYINRIYERPGAVAGVYVGYHRSQRQGSAIHSPLNCLPGAGWRPVSIERRPLGARGRVTQVVVSKGADRQLVLYWYQTATRVEGNEYWSKLHLVADAMLTRRSDAALVRIVVPIAPNQLGAVEAASRVAFDLAARLEPHVATTLFRNPQEDRSSL
jgi:EpsI family protein